MSNEKEDDKILEYITSNEENDEENLEYIKERHEMNGLGNTVVFSAIDILTFLKENGGDLLNQTPQTVIEDHSVEHVASNQREIEVFGGGKLKKSNKKSKKKSRKKSRKRKSKKNFNKKSKQKSREKCKILQKGGFSRSFFDVQTDFSLTWKDKYNWRELGIQRAFIQEVRVIWEFLIQWKCGITTGTMEGLPGGEDSGLSGSNMAKNAFPTKVLDNDELKTEYETTMAFHRRNRESYPGMYYRGDHKSLAGIPANAARVYMCDQLLMHSLINCRENSHNRWYYYFFLHLGDVLNILDKNPDLLNENPGLLKVNPDLLNENIEKISLLIYNCVYGDPDRPQGFSRELEYPHPETSTSELIFYDTWSGKNHTFKVEGGGLGSVVGWCLGGDSCTPGYYKIPEGLMNRCQIIQKEASFVLKITYPYTPFSCIAKPSNASAWHTPRNPPIGFQIVMPLLDELVGMSHEHPHIHFTLKELILASLWFPNFATCKMISFGKRTPNAYGGKLIGDETQYRTLMNNRSILEFNLLNKAIDDFGSEILNWGDGEGWLIDEQILQLYGPGDIYKIVKNYTERDVYIWMPLLLRGEKDLFQNDYLHPYYPIFNEKLSSVHQIDGLRIWSTDDMREMLSLHWIGPASFTNCLYAVSHFAGLRFGGQDPSNKYDDCYSVFCGKEHRGSVIGDAEVFHSGDYVSKLNVGGRESMLDSGNIHRIIKLKGSYVLEGGKLVAKIGVFRAAGGNLSNCSRAPLEFEFIITEGIILVDRIIEKINGDYLFMEISGMYLHHSLILKYLSEYVIGYAGQHGLTDTDEQRRAIDEALRRESTMELYDNFRDSLVTKRDSERNTRFMEHALQGVPQRSSVGRVVEATGVTEDIAIAVLTVIRGESDAIHYINQFKRDQPAGSRSAAKAATPVPAAATHAAATHTAATPAAATPGAKSHIQRRGMRHAANVRSANVEAANAANGFSGPLEQSGI